MDVPVYLRRPGRDEQRASRVDCSGLRIEMSPVIITTKPDIKPLILAQALYSVYTRIIRTRIRRRRVTFLDDLRCTSSASESAPRSVRRVRGADVFISRCYALLLV